MELTALEGSYNFVSVILNVDHCPTASSPSCGRSVSADQRRLSSGPSGCRAREFATDNDRHQAVGRRPSVLATGALLKPRLLFRHIFAYGGCRATPGLSRLLC